MGNSPIAEFHFLFLWMFISLFSTISLAQTETCIKGDCQNGKGTLKFQNGAIYEGEFKDGKYHGMGKLNWDGKEYVGEFFSSNFNGKGILVYNGNKYEGYFKDDLKNGNGTLYIANGDRYIGNFVNDKFDGYGTYTWAAGNSYRGYWKQDYRHGHGALYFEDGMKQWEGEWVEDNPISEFDYSVKSGANSGQSSSNSSQSSQSTTPTTQYQLEKSPCGFDGVWNSNWDGTSCRLYLSMVNDKQMTGTYSYSSGNSTVNGKITGTISEVLAGGSDAKVTITGTWSEGTISGTFTFSRVCSKNVFAGTWANSNGKESGHWAGTKD